MPLRCDPAIKTEASTQSRSGTERGGLSRARGPAALTARNRNRGAGGDGKEEGRRGGEEEEEARTRRAAARPEAATRRKDERYAATSPR